MKVAIFGIGALASIFYKRIKNTKNDEVVLFVTDSPESSHYEGISHISFDEFSNSNYKNDTYIFIAIGPSHINKKRSEVYDKLKKIGCSFYKYKSPYSLYDGELSDNVFISDYVSIGSTVKIGNGTFIWENVVISHNVDIGEFVYISPGAIIGSYVTVSSNSLLGMGAIIKPKVNIAEKTLIGAGTYISENTLESGVYAPAKSIFLGQVSEKIDISK